jgi:hypothetical protein
MLCNERVKVKNKEVSCIIDGENIHRLFEMSCDRMLKYRIGNCKQRRLFLFLDKFMFLPALQIL